MIEVVIGPGHVKKWMDMTATDETLKSGMNAHTLMDSLLGLHCSIFLSK